MRSLARGIITKTWGSLVFHYKLDAEFQFNNQKQINVKCRSDDYAQRLSLILFHHGLMSVYNNMFRLISLLWFINGFLQYKRCSQIILWVYMTSPDLLFILLFSRLIHMSAIEKQVCHRKNIYEYVISGVDLRKPFINKRSGNTPHLG